MDRVESSRVLTLDCNLGDFVYGAVYRERTLTSDDQLLRVVYKVVWRNYLKTESRLNIRAESLKEALELLATHASVELEQIGAA